MEGNRIAGDRVYCYQCANEWRRDQGGLTCPHCGSDFTEILSRPPSPAPGDTSQNPSSPSPHEVDDSPRPFDDHNPWEDEVPDPDEDDVSEWTQMGRLGGSGMFTISARTIRRPAGRSLPVEDPDMVEVVSDFENLLTNIMGGQPNARNRGFPGVSMMGMFPLPSESGPPPGFGPLPGFPDGGRDIRSTTQTFAGDNRGPQIQAGNIQDLFSMILSTMGNVQGPPEQAHLGGPANSPFAILSQLMNPANAQQGDAVFSQEALDRVISQLMEQNTGSTAPPPASETAIRSLPTRKVEESMMGNDGKAECSICMDEVEIGQEVTVLPCNHWFHGDCVTAWLKEHDTCPHCRKGITKSSSEAQRSQSEQPPSNSRRSSHGRTSSVTPPSSSGMERSWTNSMTVAESPRDVRAARQQYFESRSGDPDRRPNNRTSSQNEGRRNDGRRNDGRRNEGERTGSRSSSGSNNGGFGGWIRNHLPSLQ